MVLCDKCKKNEATFCEKEWNSNIILNLCEDCAIDYVYVRPFFYCTYCEKFTSSFNAVFVDNKPYCSNECALANHYIKRIDKNNE